jgi:ABC-type Mn2+/Zn2+ transport system ATPase subunit
MDELPEPLLRLRGAEFGYGRTPVLRGVDLIVRSGDLLGVAGPNGSGKSTLLRGILGLLPPLAGTVERGTAAIGYVPQRDALDAAFPISVEEVVGLGAAGRLRGLRRLARADRELVRASLARVGLADRGRELFSRLSGGQRQRALFARALVERPRLLVLDEPTTGVDRPTVEVLVGLLAELRERGVAVVFVSHELELLRAAADDVLVLAGGRVTRWAADDALAPERVAGVFGARPSGAEER